MAPITPAKSGMQLALETMLNKALANLPPEIKDNIDRIGQTVLAFKAQLDRIEAKQDFIISQLPGNPAQPSEHDHGEKPGREQ